MKQFFNDLILALVMALMPTGLLMAAMILPGMIVR